MREIKYRAYIKTLDMILDVYRINFDVKTIELRVGEDEYFHNDLMEYDFSEIQLMQSTGLVDKKEVEIYEGDIIRYTFDSPEQTYATENGLKIRTGQIFWSEWRSSFAVGKRNLNTDVFRYVRNGNRVEVIGNIYENPELLKI